MRQTKALLVLFCAAMLVLSSACGADPKIHHYKLALEGPTKKAKQGEAAWTLGVDYLVADAAYDDVRIVYRQSPYRLDYYHYHRWSAPPGVMVTDVLRQGFQDTGKFRSVVGGYSADVDLMLRGRLLAIEEVDESKNAWTAHMKLDLYLQDMSTGKVIWHRLITLEKEVEKRNPEGVVEALSKGLDGLVGKLAGELVESKTRSMQASRESAVP